MSDRRYTAIFGAAVLTAGVATFSVYRMLRAAAEPRRELTRAVVVVARDVPAGVAVPREALTQVLWPQRVAPPEAVESPDSVAGRVTRVPLVRGEPVRVTALAPRGAAPGLEGTIAPDRRAIAVKVNEAAGVSGLLRPDSRVDVLVTSHGDNTGTTARLVMADVRVLGVGPARPGDTPKEGEPQEPMPANIASIVTLEVTPAQAAQVAAAEQLGTIQVVLRGFGSRDAAPGAADATLDVAALAPAAGAPGMQPAGGAPQYAWPGAGGQARHGFGARSQPSVSTSAEPPTHVGARPRPAAAAHAASAPAEPVAAAPAAPPATPHPDSVTIHVYRGGQMTQMRVEASAQQPAAPAPAGAPLRTAALGAP